MLKHKFDIAIIDNETGEILSVRNSKVCNITDFKLFFSEFEYLLNSKDTKVSMHITSTPVFELKEGELF